MTAASLIEFRTVFSPHLKLYHYLVKAASLIKVNLIEIYLAPRTDPCSLCINTSQMTRSSAVGLPHSLALIKKTIKGGEVERFKQFNLVHQLTNYANVHKFRRKRSNPLYPINTEESKQVAWYTT